MKRMNLYQTGIALLVLLLATACDKEEFDGSPADGEPQPIRFDIAVATATPSGPSTRVSTATDFTSSFTAGNRVGLYIVKGDGGLQASGNWVENVPMTFDGTSWNCDLPVGKKYYPKDGSKLSFYAYYPYNTQVSNPLAMSFSVQADQSAGLSSSYLMTASQKGVPKSHDPVQLTFSHKLAMVKVNLKDGVAAKDKAPFPANVVTLKGRQLTTSLNLATDAVGSSGDATDVKMYYNETEKCWYALVPQQVVTIGSVQLTFEWTQILTLKHTPTTRFTLAMAAVNPLDITIDANMEIDPNHVYKVGDAYPHVGFDKKGVVFEVSDGGKSGKIISLQRWPNIAWSTETVEVGADNFDNGRVNMATVMTLDAKFTNYPAFLKVHGLNPQGTTYKADSKEIWYLPAGNELLQMYQDENNKEKVGRTLKALGMDDPFLDNNHGWSSTELPQIEKASCYSLFYGTPIGLVKDYEAYVWPIRAF